MNARVTVSVLALALAAGMAYNAAARRAGSPSCCTATSAPMLLASAKAAPAKPAPKKPAKPAPKAQRKLVAYYFHGNFRCASCVQIEALTNAAIQENFQKELKSGRLEWRVVNVEQKGNDHFMKDYKLYTKSVVLSDTKDGKEIRWKNLEKVWNLLGDPVAFKSYVKGEISSYLKVA